MTQSTKNRPVHVERLGLMKAAVFQNEGASGPFYTVQLTRSYRLPEEKRSGANDDGWREEKLSCGRDDLVLLAKVADQAHTWCYSNRPE